MQPFFVYILQCTDHTYYVGHTDSIELRLAQHRFGEYDSYTATRLPIALMFVQEFETRAEAIEAERQIKNWSRKKKEALINGDFTKLSLLGKKKFSK